MYYFKEQNQSPWIIKYYNEYFKNTPDGFLVEIGVGHTLQGTDNIKEKTLEGFSSSSPRVGSNTADLLDLGWSGIYVEPVSEYCKEAEIAHDKNIKRLTIVNKGAGKEKIKLPLYLGDSFVPNNFPDQGYDWIGRIVEIDKTSVILEESGCPSKIDLMSIDVEGFEENVILGMDFEKFYVKMLIIEINQTSINTIQNLLPSSFKLLDSDSLNALWINTKKER